MKIVNILKISIFPANNVIFQWENKNIFNHLNFKERISINSLRNLSSNFKKNSLWNLYKEINDYFIFLIILYSFPK